MAKTQNRVFRKMCNLKHVLFNDLRFFEGAVVMLPVIHPLLTAMIKYTEYIWKQKLSTPVIRTRV